MEEAKLEAVLRDDRGYIPGSIEGLDSIREIITSLVERRTMYHA